MARQKFCPRDQRLRQVRDQCELVQPLQYTPRQTLARILTGRRVSTCDVLGEDPLKKDVPSGTVVRSW